jgi:16S rRNA (guanine1207-N2)-methyltransferase
VNDPALAALMLPLQEGALDRRAQTLFLRARWHPALSTFSAGTLTCSQSLLPAADLLAQAELLRPIEPEQRFETVLGLPPRQREESRALLAQAVNRVAPGGTVVMSALNDEGARSMQSDLEQLCGEVHTRSKFHCRVVQAQVNHVNTALLAEWLELDAPRQILDGMLWSRPGVFAWDHIDRGSALLLQCLPRDLRGHGADLGAGIGVLARAALEQNPGITKLDLIEAEQRALDMAARNLQHEPRAELIWADVTRGLQRRYDFILTNPPFHLGRADLPGLGTRFIEVAADALQPGGILYLVANRHLPYEATLGAFCSREVLIETGGFKVIKAQK